MPWKSDAQRRWGNSPSGIQAMGKTKVHEFNEATKGKKLPDKLPNQPSHITRVTHRKTRG